MVKPTDSAVLTSRATRLPRAAQLIRTATAWSIAASGAIGCDHSHSATAPPPPPRPSGTITGIVTSSVAGPLAGVTVTATVTTLATAHSVMTDSSGKFTFDSVPQGAGTLAVANLPIGCSSPSPVSYIAATDSSVEEQNIVVPCQRQVGTIIGTVWGSPGYGMANVTISVKPAVGVGPASVTTDANGNFVVSNVPIGSGSVVASSLPTGCSISGPANYSGLTFQGTDTVSVLGSCPPPAFANEMVIGQNGSMAFFLMQANGTGVRQITHDPLPLRDVGWSPDGRRFVAGEYDVATQGDRLVLFDTDGTHFRYITSGANGDQNPDWSPGGDKIAFISQPLNSDSQIWVIDTDGTNLTQLTHDVYPQAWPHWSPDGSTIAYQSAHGSGVGHIYLMNADGTNPRALTTDPQGDGQPSWSPDGTKIAFVSQRDGIDQIYVMNADGSGQTRLTYDTNLDGGPIFSPDGTQIAFTQTIVNGPGNLYVMNASDGSGLTLLKAGAGIDAWKHVPPTGLAVRVRMRR